MFNISLGIMTYNEEANIGRLMRSVLKQKFTHAHLKEIFIVSSGCTDRSEEIVRNFMKQDRRVTLLIQPRREGKASAINLFLSEASGEILILESGDTIPEQGTLDKLVAPFKDPCIGMTGAHPVPVNSKKTFIGFSVHLMWALHHKIALMSPKLGELVAFRNFVRKIPNDTAADEASIEGIVKEKGYGLHYVPDAVVENKGPENIRDFIKQRRRIAAGHKHLLREQEHEVSTLDSKMILRMLIQEHSWKFRETLWTFGAVTLELIGRILGYYDFYIRKKNPFVWDIASSTKNLN
ncbi:MAG: glycosyltransferase [Deltaproteobacteria bacterium]|nr:glycosyltransferase [Deltaproteobacteria bacterium]